MEGTIAIQEKRNVIDKFKSWYKEKIIDSGQSAKMEEGIFTFVDLAGDMFTLNCVVGATIVSIIAAIPTSGLSLGLGTAISAGILATSPIITGIIKKFGAKAAIGTKRALEAIFIGENGQSDTIEIKDIDITDTAYQLGEIATIHGVEIVSEYEKQKAEKAKKIAEEYVPQQNTSTTKEVFETPLADTREIFSKKI